MAEALVRRDHGFKFWGHGRIERHLDAENLDLLKRAGFSHFIFGLESGSSRVLKLMRKGYTAETASRVLQDVRNAGIGCSVNIVTGFPGETWNDCLDTINFVKAHREGISPMPGISECSATQGSDIYLYPERFGIAVEADGRPHHYHWRTLDGSNTLEVRLARKEWMLQIFKELEFGKAAKPQMPQLEIVCER